MKLSGLSQQALLAFLAGRARGFAREYIAKARANADYPEARRIYTNAARAERAASVRYIKMARDYVR